MRWTQVPYSTRNNLLRMYDDKQRREEFHKAVGILGIPLSTVERRLREHRHQQSLKSRLDMPSKIYNDYLHIETDDAIVISDIELPDADPIMLQAAIAMGKQYGIKTLIIAGDLIATDQASLNSWEEVIKTGDEPPFQRVIEHTKQVLKTFGEQFKTMYCISGNHDERVARKTGGEVHLGMLLPDLKFSQYNFMWIKTSRGYVYITHPQNYSSNSAGLGQKLYNVTVAPDSSKPHVVLAHTHQAQQATSPDGIREIHALGTMRDPLKTKYKSTRSNTHHQWTQGFLMLRKGYFYPMVRGTTDWQFYLKDLCPRELQK